MSNLLNTVDIPKSGSGVPKTLQPGNQVCRVLSVEMKPFSFKPGSYEIMLSVVGPDLGGDFQGFFIDKNNESLGHHKGQVGRIKASLWAFADAETKSKVKISRDTEILKWLNSFCEAIGKKDWMTAQDQKHATIESLIDAFIKDKPFKDIEINFCIAGKEYMNKGYMNHDLFLPKFTKAGVPFELAGVAKSKLAVFNETEHIIKNKVSTVANFVPGSEEESVGGAVASAQSDFEL